eukprot:gene15608-17180_t
MAMAEQQQQKEGKIVLDGFPELLRRQQGRVDQIQRRKCGDYGSRRLHFTQWHSNVGLTEHGAEVRQEANLEETYAKTTVGTHADERKILGISEYHGTSQRT